MRTVTEFPAPTLKNAAKVQQELQTAGKTAEEMPAALGEALKLEGDKLNFLIAALETVGTKLDDLKRVLVMQLSEGEKAPHKALQKGEHWFVSEYFAPLHGHKKAKEGHEGREGKGERGGKGRGDRRGKRGERGGENEGRGKGRGGRGRRDGEAPREGVSMAAEGAPNGGQGANGEKREGRGPRRNRGPRRPSAANMAPAEPEKPPVPSTDPNAPKIAPRVVLNKPAEATQESSKES